MNKKVISSILACAMSVSAMSIAVSASTVAPPSQLSSASKSYAVNATLNSPKVTASIPTAVKAFINPYKAVVKDDVYGDSFASGIASPTYKIINGMTDSKLAVTVTPGITPSDTVELSAKPLTEKERSKKVFAYLNTTTLETGTTTKTPVFKNTSYVANDATQALFKEEATPVANIMIIKEAANASDTTAVGYFRVEGDCTEKPEEAWTSTDKVSLSLVLDLAPSIGGDKDLTLDSIKIKTDDIEGFAADKTEYSISATSVAAATDTITIVSKATSATASEITFVALLNGTEIPTASGAKATAAVTPNAANGTGKVVITPVAGKIEAGDVIEVIIINGTASKTYKITVTE